VATASAAMQQILPGAVRAQPTPKRKSIESLSPPELDAYERAIQTAKARSQANPADPTGYQYWADLHDVFDTTVHSGCPHFSEKFLPWHRRHLADFEKVLQKAVPGVTDNVTIPYWDWTKPPKEGVHFPKAFERQASPLFDRRLNLNPPPWDPVDVHNIVKSPDWSAFGGLPDPSDEFGQNPGSLESGPHNTLHFNISRDMRVPQSASNDPIFWSFHAFIDLIWTRWQRLHVTDQNPQPFQNGEAIIWFRDRSFAIKTTAKIADFNYDYDYDYAGADGPVPSPALMAAAQTVSVYAPAKRSMPLATAAETGRYLTLRPSGPITTTSNVALRIVGATVYSDKSYRMDLYLHAGNVDIASIDAQARRPLLVRTIGIWRTHHGGKVQLFVRLTPDQVVQLNNGWVLTVVSQLAVADEDVRSAMSSPQSAALSLPATSSLVQQVEIQER
jgi:tyrosinase